MGEYGKIRILKIGGKLYYNDADIELIPESKTKFFRADDNDRTIEFVDDKTDGYNSIILTKGGVKEVFPRSNRN
ncbi:hypothetical protein D3C72_1412480 [compost metagenome]